MSQPTRLCKKCNVEQDIAEFPEYKPGFRRWACRGCNNARVNASHKNNEKWRAGRREYSRVRFVNRPEMRDRANATCRKRTERYRQEVISAYGGECVACGESEPLFLTLDHIENDGKSWRRIHSHSTTNMYLWLKKHGYPEIVQVLCMNCNFGKARNGGVLVKDRRSIEGSTTIPSGSTDKRPEVPHTLKLVG